MTKLRTLKAVPSAAKPNRPHRLAGPALALGSLLLLSLGAQPAFAACGGVTMVGDEAELNAAIETFNADTTSESCVYTIQLDADIDLNESTTPIQNVISGKSLIIEGGGYQVDGQDGVIVQGFDGMQPFAIESGTVVTMNDLTVTGGKPVGGGALKRGGGIRNDGTLRLNRCTVVGNETDTSGGGIANRGTLVIDSSTISGNASAAGLGGGIYSEGGSVTITNSTISGNDADSPGLNDGGGGIFASGSLTLDSVTITDNFSRGRQRYLRRYGRRRPDHRQHHTLRQFPAGPTATSTPPAAARCWIRATISSSARMAAASRWRQQQYPVSRISRSSGR